MAMRAESGSERREDGEGGMTLKQGSLPQVGRLPHAWVRVVAARFFYNTLPRRR